MLGRFWGGWSTGVGSPEGRTPSQWTLWTSLRSGHTGVEVRLGEPLRRAATSVPPCLRRPVTSSSLCFCFLCLLRNSRYRFCLTALIVHGDGARYPTLHRPCCVFVFGVSRTRGYFAVIYRADTTLSKAKTRFWNKFTQITKTHFLVFTKNF